MTYYFKHRAISLLLAFALLLSMMPGGVLPVHSVESESNETVDTESVSTKEFDHLIDRVATFSEYYDTFMLAPLPSKVTGYENVQWSNAVNYSVYDYIGDDSALSDDEYYALYDAFYAIKLVIKECYIAAESHGALWFRVEAAEGETLPEIFQENPWIFAFYSGFEGEDKNIALNVRHADLLTGVYVEGAPEDTELVVEVPTVDGEAIPGLYDIKMYDEDGNEWQPIDEGKTVTISIPVEDVDDGEYVDVYHFIDYAADIDGDEEIISTEGVDEAAMAILQPALEAYGHDADVAVEITRKVIATNGTASIETNSFSIYTPDYAYQGDSFTVSFTSSADQEDPANEKTYYATIGQTITFEFMYSGIAVDQNGKYTLTRLSDGAIIKDQDEAESTTTGFINVTYREYVTYEFSDEGLGVDVQAGDLFEITWTSNKSYQPKNPRWTRVMIVGEYSTTFNANGGTFAGGEATHAQTIISYQPVSVVEAPTRPGYVFTGWNTAADGSGTAYAATDNFPAVIAEGAVFYAQWEALQYTVTYVLPDNVTNSGLFTSQIKYHDISLTLNENTPLVDGDTQFLYWVDSNGNQYAPGGSYTGNADLTLIAVWDKPVYTVTYDANGGTGAPAPQYLDTSVDTSGKITLTTAAPTRPGYTFAGWNTAANGTGTSYASGASISLSNNVTLYAQWTEISYTIAFDGNGGSGNMESMSGLSYNGYANLTANSFTNNPQTFQGWALTSGATEILYTNGQNVKVSDLVTAAAQSGQSGSTITLYAVWATETFTITYDPNGGSAGVISQTVIATDGTATATINNSCGLSGHTFMGWKLSGADADPYEIGDIIPNSNTDTITLTADITLTAVWNLNVVGYIGTMDSNNNLTMMGTITDANGNVHEGKYIQAIEEGGDITGMTFTPPAGYEIVQIWVKATQQDVENKTTYSYASESNITAPFNVVVIVAPKTVTITFVDADGTTVLETISGVYGSAVAAPANPTKTGYTFDGWDKEVPATMPAEDLTIKASWTANIYTITYDANGGNAVAAEQYPYGTVITKLPKPSREGYTFVGWLYEGTQVSDAEGNIRIGDETQYVMSNQNITLTAQWTINSYTVTFVDGNGTTLKTQPVNYGGAATAPADPTREGYTFTGWDVAFDNVTSDLTVTATWTVNQYKILWVVDGVTVRTDTVAYNAVPNITAPNNPEKEGYTFAGWDKEIPATMPANDVTITAQWTINSYTVTWNVDGVETTETYAYGATITKKAASSKPGYTFAGWSGYTDGMTMPAENLTFTAQWNIIQYTIIFDSNGGSAVGNLSYNITTNLTLPINPTRTGYTFDGWKITVADGNWNTDNTYWHVSPLGTGYYGNIALTAQWKANSYTVKFDANDGSGSMDDQSFTYGVAQALTANGFTKTGYTFAGWNTAEDGTGTSYTNGQLVSNLTSAENGIVTLYAQWTINQHTVNVDYDSSMVTVTINGVEVTDSSDYYFDYGAHVTITITPKDGYTIETVTQNDASWGTIVESGHSETIEVKGNIKIVATAKLKTYTVTYNLGFHYNADVTSNQTEFPNQTKTHGQPLTLHNQNPVATGAVFAGWDINGDNVKDYGVGDTIELNQNVTLTALWEPEPYQVTYMVEGLANGQTITIDSQAGFYKNTITLTIPSVVGYTLTTKSAISGGNVVSIDGDGKIVMPAGDVVVTLTYAPNSYTVTFNSNSGSGDMANQTFAYDEEKALTANGFTRTGYTFAGWNTATDGSGTAYGDKAAVKNLTAANGAEVTLYAQWNVVTYNITYDLAGGTVSGNPATYTVESGVITLVNPTKIGYTFAGWTGTGLDGATMDVTIPAGSTGNRSYTATWTPNTDTQYTVYHYLQNLDGTSYALYLTQPLTGTTGASVTPALQTPVGFTAPSAQTVIISADGSTVVKYYYIRNSYQVTWDVDGTTTTETYEYGATVTAPADPAKEGHTFAGWTPAVPATMPAENLTFTATWTTNEYTVTWDVDGATTTETYEYGATIVKPADPAKEGYTFADWTPAVPGTMPAENLIFTAQWTVNQYTVTFVLGNGQPDIVQTYAYGATVTAPGAPSRAGYTFGGWDTSVPVTMPAENLTFTATWTEIRRSLTISKKVQNIGINTLNINQEFVFIVTIPGNRTKADFDGLDIDWISDTQFRVTLAIRESVPAGAMSSTASVRIENLPLGVYTVVEQYEPGYEPDFGGDTQHIDVALTDNADGEATCTNTYPVYVGDLTVEKEVVSAYDGDDPTEAEFAFELTLTPDPDVIALQPEYTYTFVKTLTDGTTETGGATVGTDGKYIIAFTLKAGEKIRFKGLPIGEYAVTEAAQTGYVSDPARTTGTSGEIVSDRTPDATPTARFVNIFNRTTGTLKVEKTIDNIGTVAAEAEERTFTFRVTLPDDVTKADFVAKYTAGDITWSADERSFTFTITFTFAVAAGATVSQSKVFANVPSGDYEIAETDTPVGFVPIVSPVTAEVRSGAEATATFVNQYPVYLITYQVVGEGGTVTVSGNNGVSVSEKVNKNAAAVGATANAAEGYRFVGWFSDSGCTGTPLSTALTYAPTKPDAGWSENLTVYAKFEPIGSLTIEKVVDNKDDADLTNQSFTFTVTMPGGKKVADYVAVGGAVTAIDSANNSFTVTITIAAVGANATASSMVTLNGLPMGTYTVKETGIASGFVSDWDGDTTTVTLSGASASVTATCTNEYPVYRVDYIVEGPGGTVKLYNVAGNAASVYEIYNFVTGAPAGATATAANGYQFEGWYLNDVRVSPELTFTPETAKENRVYKAKFVENTAHISFEIVDPNGYRFTADTDWVKLTTYSTTIGSATGDISSTVTDLSVVYKFMGWYSDPACTNKLSDELTYTPQKIDDLHVAATYYAKFAYNLTSLDITVQLATPLDEDQSFVLYLTDNATGNKLTVSVHVPASSTTGTATIMGVTVGHSYTVTLDSNWAWRYDNAPTWAYESVSSGSGFAASFTAEVDGTLSFIVAPSDNQWLDGYDWLDQWLNGTP